MDILLKILEMSVVRDIYTHLSLSNNGFSPKILWVIKRKSFRGATDFESHALKSRCQGKWVRGYGAPKLRWLPLLQLPRLSRNCPSTAATLPLLPRHFRCDTAATIPTPPQLQWHSGNYPIKNLRRGFRRFSSLENYFFPSCACVAFVTEIFPWTAYRLATRELLFVMCDGFRHWRLTVFH